MLYRIIRKIKNKILSNRQKQNSEIGKLKIYNPYYNFNVPIEDSFPEIYNKDGLPMDFFFIRDCHGAHCPYRDSSKYFIWDRFNYACKTHFYTHNSMLETMGTPIKKYGFLIESEAIVPADYQIFERNKGLENDFDSIFTYSEPILNKIKNAKFFPSCANIFYSKEIGLSFIPDSLQYQKKIKNISMICSEKKETKYHIIRNYIATQLKSNKNVDCFGRFSGGQYLPFKANALKDYRFHIVIENDIKPFYFTEKIMDCFISMTIPIYLGATKITSFFNSDGIIVLNENDCENIENIIKICTPNFYNERITAVIENYKKALPYLNMNDKLYEDFFK